MASSLASLLLIFIVLSSCYGRKMLIDNVRPRLDVNGKIIDAHDGSIQQFTIANTTLYYMHAMSYGLCKEPDTTGCAPTPDGCGFQLHHNISIYTSPDLSTGSWTYVGNAINVNDRPPGIVFRPHLLYNPNTKLYVLWWNYDNDGKALLAAATAPTPSGPFTMRNNQINVTDGEESGDYTIFADDDGSAYIVYSMNYVMHIEKLTDDYLYSTGIRGPDFLEYFVEAPVMFKRKGLYYVLFGHCCCYCEQGSGIMVHTATNPLGPYTTIGADVACVLSSSVNTTFPTNTTFTADEGCQYANANYTSIVQSQQNFVIQVPTSTGMAYIWTGDRWQQAPDHIKGHDPQYWAPLEFTANGGIMNVTWQDYFVVDVL